MIENDWMVETTFFYKMTGIESAFFERYFQRSQDFELQNITHLANRAQS